MKASLLELVVCPSCEGRLTVSHEQPGDVTAKELVCSHCGEVYPVVEGVPFLFREADRQDSSTSQLYGDIWKAYRDEDASERRRKSRGYDAPARSHHDLLRLASGRDIVEPGVGIDAGCGDGRATVDLALSHPDVTLVGVDLSEGPLLSAARAEEAPNVHLVRADLLAPPLMPGRFDFIYSFGVLHHTPDPRECFRLLVKRLRPGGRITIFVYKDFSDLPVKRFLLRQVNRLRGLTTKMAPATLRRVARAAAPLVYILLTIPARVLRRVGLGRLAQHIPYGTFPNVRNVASSLEDRFGAPYEFRFSIGDLEKWASEEALVDRTVVDCLPWGFSGLVLAGRRRPEDVATRGTNGTHGSEFRLS